MKDGNIVALMIFSVLLSIELYCVHGLKNQAEKWSKITHTKSGSSARKIERVPF